MTEIGPNLAGSWNATADRWNQWADLGQDERAAYFSAVLGTPSPDIVSHIVARMAERVAEPGR